MAIKKNQSWKSGDLFAVPQSDGMESLGQIVSIEGEALNSVICAFYDSRNLKGNGFSEIPATEKMIAILFVTPDLLNDGVWRVCGNSASVGLERMTKFQEWKSNGYIGVKVIGSGIILKFLNAFYGLHPWDGWKDPLYLDNLLISPDKKPTKVVYKNVL